MKSSRSSRKRLAPSSTMASASLRQLSVRRLPKGSPGRVVRKAAGLVLVAQRLAAQQRRAELVAGEVAEAHPLRRGLKKVLLPRQGLLRLPSRKRVVGQVRLEQALQRHQVQKLYSRGVSWLLN